MEGGQLARYEAAHACAQDQRRCADAARAARTALHRCGLPAPRHPSQPTLSAAVATCTAAGAADSAAAVATAVTTTSIAAALAAATLAAAIAAAIAAAALAAAPDGAAAAALTAVA